jgi:hypothetical protein
VVVDEPNGAVTVLATSPEAGGSIYKKTSPLNAISFPSGKGSLFIRDGASLDMNDATSTKDGVSPATGLVVLASNDTTDFYWHNWDSLVLDADFTVSQTGGTAPLTVNFNDTSTGNPTAWSWDFGDGSAPSTEQNPSHAYDAAGSFTVTLTTWTPNGATSVETKTSAVTVTPSVIYTPTDDSWVRSTAPTSNYGTQSVLSIRSQPSTGTFQRAYLRFAVTGMTQPVVAAKLRLYVRDPSPDGGAVYLTGAAWTERTITWNNAPPLTGDALGAAGAVETGTWAEIPLPSILFSAGDGIYTFGIANASNDTVGYGSRQSATAPQLVLGIPG